MVTDSFTRANAPTLGSDWTDVVAGLGIVSNSARATGGSQYEVAYYSAASFGDDHTSQADVHDNVGNVAGVAVRVQANGDCYLLYCAPNLGSTRLFKFIGGSLTELVDYGVGSSTGDSMKLEASGTTLRAYKNGVQMGTDTSDGTLSSGGAPGVFGRNDNPADLKNWVGTGEVVAAPSNPARIIFEKAA